MKSIYPNLSAELLRHKITYKQLAEELNMYAPAISYRMTGKIKFKVDEIYKIVEMLDCDFLYLFEERK